MILKKLIVQGVNYRRTIAFNEGFTIISGEKTSGKSLVLSLIDYSLGKSSKIDLKVQKELSVHCDDIFLEFEINGNFFTFNRSLKKNVSNINIYFCRFDEIDGYTPKVLALNEAMKFLMTELNINEYKIIKHKNRSTQKTLEVVSFRDLFRFVYVNQHALGTHDFLDNKSTFKKNKNPHAFKLMFNLVEKDTASLKEDIVETQNTLVDEQKVILGLSAYLKDKSAEDFNKLTSRAKSLNVDITTKKKSKDVIVNSSKSNKDNENKMYIGLKSELEELANTISNYRKEKRKLEVSINSKLILIEEYEYEIIELDATLEVNYKLTIPNQNLECPLCNSTVVTSSHTELHSKQNPEKTLLKIKKDLQSKIKLVSILITKDMKKIEELDMNILRLNKKERILKNAMSEFAKETDVPFLSELNSINTLVNQMTKELESVKESMRIHRKIDEKNANIDTLNSKVKRLEKELKELKVSKETQENIFNFLDSEYKGFMRRFKYPIKDDTFIHQENYIPFYAGSNVYAHESGGLLECMQLSYLAAILKSKDEGYAPGHPGILLLDSISKYVGTLRKDSKHISDSSEIQQENGNLDINKKEHLINDPEVYEEFYKILIELSSNHQIILVENTPPEKFHSYVKYTFLSGEKGLIDLKANEFTDFL